MNCRSSKMRMVEAASEIGLEHDLGRSRLPAVQASSKPRCVQASIRYASYPVSVSCPVLSSKLLFISMRTWRAWEPNSCTAFSKWASLSLRVAEPPVCAVAKVLKMAD